jgi:hypothetical protein
LRRYNACGHQARSEILIRELLAYQRQHRRIREVKWDRASGEYQERTTGEKYAQSARLIPARRFVVYVAKTATKIMVDSPPRYCEDADECSLPP